MNSSYAYGLNLEPGSAFAQPSQANTLLTDRQTVFEFEKYARLKPYSIVVNKRFVRQGSSTQTNRNSLSNLDKAGQYNRYMSPATRRKVKGIIENYLTALQLNTDMSFPSKAIYPTFVTLTLPGKQVDCDNVIKKECFFRFLEYLKLHWQVMNYIWVSETQENGNIHFHVIIDRALPADRLNQVWNQHLDRLDYVYRFRRRQMYIYADGFRVRRDMLIQRVEQARKAAQAMRKSFDARKAAHNEKKRQKEAYERGMASNWNNPPTTKIHSIQSISKLTAYVSKYMTKEPRLKKMKLGENETLIQEEDSFYVVSSTTEKVMTYAYQKKPNGLVDVVEAEKEIVHEDKRQVLVHFTNRRLRGKIWGASKMLHHKKLVPACCWKPTRSMPISRRKPGVEW